MIQAYLLLGTNLGDRAKNLAECIKSLEEIGIEVKQQSSIYETEPWGFGEQPSFYNQSLLVETTFSPTDLLYQIKELEVKLGRVDFGRWKERLIDIDIIYYGELILKSEELIIPHPELHTRRFVLMPLTEIAPEFLHPIFKISNLELLERCPDELKVVKIQV